MTPFELAGHDLGSVALRPLTAENAQKLARTLSAMPPWSVIGYPADRLADWLQHEQPALKKFEVLAMDDLAGVIVIQDPFLHGPYLKLIAILPEFQGRSFGLRLLHWMESEARRSEARQLWLCVSTFNTRAQAFYERYGFQAVAMLDKLASDGSDELLMRKRLRYGRPGL